MKKPILDRYARTADGSLAIDISTNRAADLYNNFDKTTPFAKKELDADLVEYLIDSVQEIEPDDYVIRFHFPEAGTRCYVRVGVKTNIGKSAFSGIPTEPQYEIAKQLCQPLWS